jgi:hypothetical protein
MPEERERTETERRFRDRLRGLLAVEGIALAIALVAPVTPSKTGSTWSPAELFDSDPGYLDKVLASFVTVNLLVLLIGAVAWVLLRVDAR